MKSLIRLAVVAVSVAACGAQPAAEKPKPDTPAASRSGWYRAVLSFDGAGDVPFFIELRADGVAVVINGKEELKGPYRWSGPKGDRTIEIDVDPVQGSRITASEQQGGVLSGTWTTTAPPILGKKSFSFQAQPVDRLDWKLLFPGPSQDLAPALGTWKIEFEREGLGMGKFILEQLDPSSISATIQNPTSDFRYFAGSMRDGGLVLSSFDGFHGYLMRGTFSEDGKSMTGKLFFWDFGSSDFTATKVSDDFDAFDQLSVIKLPEDAARTSDILKPYAGKPMIVAVAGTWCTICKDLVPVLKDLDRRYSALQIVLLYVEFTDNATAAKKVEGYKKANDIPWPVFPFGDFEQLKDAAPGLGSLEGLPLTVFVRRDGAVHAVHAGFASAAASEEYEAQKKEFDRLAREVVAP